VGGEPLVRHRELSRVLPILSNMKVHTMVVTSAVIPIPLEWMSIPRVRVTVFFNVPGALKHGPGDRPMHVYLTSGDVLQDAVVRRWLAPHVMMFREAIHRNCGRC
jgi:hypothetical protein